MGFINYYTVLGINQTASLDDIKKSYRRLAREYHPDKNNNPGTEEKFKEVGAAYQNLSDPEKREIHNMHLYQRLRKDSEPCADDVLKTVLVAGGVALGVFGAFYLVREVITHLNKKRKYDEEEPIEE